MASNFLNYTGLTFDEIVSQAASKLSQDSNLINLRDSELKQFVVDMLAAVADMNNYNIERVAEENFFDFLKKRSSAVGLSKNLGYDITRAIPSEAKIKIRLSGDLTAKNIQVDDYFQIPIWTSFTYGGQSLILKDTFTYIFSSSDVNSISTNGEDFQLDIEYDVNGNEIELVQGELTDIVIDGSTNDQIGKTFQTYKISDTEFSNKYGSKDYNTPMTRVKVGETYADATEYVINRRSLISWEVISNSQLGETQSVCVLRSTPDENMELKFGNGQFAELGAVEVSADGPSTTSQNIYITYLKTKGSDGNKIGAVGKKLSTSANVTVNGEDITNNVEFIFTTNIKNGSDFESIESISTNAPNIYYSLDRVVSKKDYEYYLKSLTSPINIKNAFAWGEQEEYEKNNYEPIPKLFNVALFCCLASIYNVDSSPYSVRTESNNLNDSLLDLEYDEDGVQNQSYFNVYVKQNVVEQLKRYETSATVWVTYGDEESNFNAQNFISTYDTSAFMVNYTSDVFLSAFGGYQELILDLSVATDENDIASEIQTKLRTVTDDRLNSSLNPTYGELFFSAVNVNWDSVNSRFVISGDSTDLGYVQSIEDDVNLVSTLGLDSNLASKVSILSVNDLESDKINLVVDELDKRSQITLKNIYMSPILQNFNITGTIYVNKFADKETLHTTIKDNLYEWFDKNIDFNTEVYLSNIVEQIEKYTNVKYANIDIVPNVPTPTGEYFFSADDSIFDNVQYAADKSAIVNAFIFSLDDYFTVGGNIATDYLTEITTNIYNYNGSNKSLIYDNLSWFNHITERSFYNDFVQLLYNALPNYNSKGGTPFRDTQDFIRTVSKIHKDLAYIIRYNMLDTHGNIAEEKRYKTVNGIETLVKYKGGYTLGSEIPKFNVNTSIQYVGG